MRSEVYVIKSLSTWYKAIPKKMLACYYLPFIINQTATTCDINLYHGDNYNKIIIHVHVGGAYCRL